MPAVPEVRPGTGEPVAASSHSPLRRPFVLAATVALAAAGAALLLLWNPVAAPAEWVAGAMIGLGLLAVTVLFDAVLVQRSRRPLEVALLALRAATDDLVQTNTMLTESNRALAETAEERYQALARLQAATRERERFLGAITHDLRTPLTVIKGHAQLLRQRVGAIGGDAGRAADASAARIEQTSAQMADLLNELLESVRAGAGNLPQLRRGPTDLVALAREATARYAEPFEAHPIRLDAPASPIVGNWDARRLERLLDNLLSNAIKYSPGGGEIRLSVAREAGEAVLAVADRGLGIPADDLPRVFEPYYRGANVADELPGAGLGLTGTWTTVDAHGGTIAVTSREGRGTTITVHLPLGLDVMAAPTEVLRRSSDAGL
jgi:signal transduction histidine kinase